MKIGFYNPYFDGLGGGERYTLTLASHWSKTHEVVIFWDDPNILGISEKRFGIDLSHVRVVPNIFQNANIFGKLWVSRTYDLIFFLSDGSVPASLAKHNILHFQVPFPSVMSDPLKLNRYDAIICNSNFTKRELDPVVGNRASVIYPPVQHVPISNDIKKKKQILSVGRFTGYHQAKKQDVLIEAMKQGVSSKVFAGWELVLAGGLIPSDSEYFASVKRSVEGLPIRLMPNITNDELIALYQSGSLYWHAAGFNVTNPMHMEHFGITTAEAMSAGVVPLVYAAGGQLEIVEDGVNGLVWRTISELVDKTAMLIQDRKQMNTLSQQAIERSKSFGITQFTRGFDAIITGWK